MIRTRPFAPLPIYLTDGQTYDIRHPDQIIVLPGRVDIGVQPDPETGAPQRVDHVSLLHVVCVEPIDSQSAPAPS